MKRLKYFILFFSLALSIPLAYFVLRTYHGLEQEEVATLRYFAETLFDEMESALAVIVQKEEGRAIDEFNYQMSPSDFKSGKGKAQLSPLSRLPRENYILGYFQNNPDGSFQTPLVKNDSQIPASLTGLYTQLNKANDIFNSKRVAATDSVRPPPAIAVAEKEGNQDIGLAEKYLDRSRSQRPRAFLGQKEKKVTKITVDQAANIAKQEQMEYRRNAGLAGEAKDREDDLDVEVLAIRKAPPAKKGLTRQSYPEESATVMQSTPYEEADEPAGFQVEVAPLQAVFLSDAQIFIFRRIMINQQIYRQGFVLEVNPFLGYLADNFFLNQPMARFTGLKLSILDQGRETEVMEAGAVSENPDFILHRGFPSPFTFLKATIRCDQIPRSEGRMTLTLMLVVLAAIVLVGLFAIYQSARTIVDLSERRSQFVASVTHELKTPLTNIRMYIEMLEQGIARNPEREQEYFRILDSEGSRLSRLINNVLEMSKLEKKQRHVDLQTGNFEDVITEVKAIMTEKIKQEGFTLKIDASPLRPFKYDREVMIQVIINLIENSMKFGKTSPLREIHIRTHQEDSKVKIMVIDSGPGIPRHAIKKIFNDFYRVENALTRTTRGTGIGLALVKKFIQLLGGTVSAANNNGPGCTITITLPA